MGTAVHSTPCDNCRIVSKCRMPPGLHGALAGRADATVDKGPALVSILRQGPYLIASIHTALNDSQIGALSASLVDRIGLGRSTGIIIDVAALDVVDWLGHEPYATSPRWPACAEQLPSLSASSLMWRSPWVDPGLHTSAAHTALDLEEGLAYLRRAGPAAL